MTKDLLFFITNNETSKLPDNLGAQGNFAINPLSFIINTLIVILLIFLTIFILKHLSKVKPSNHSYLLKEIPISPSLKIMFITIGKKLYILANSNTQLILMDTIKEQKEILNILTKEEENETNRTINFFGFFKQKKKTKIDEKFENTLKNIIINSNTLEDLNKK